jgi:Immunity protein 42
MIVGNPNIFAIESEITHAYEHTSHLALGFFVVHVAGRSFGIKERDASMLGVSFDQVGKRIARRGSHHPPFPMDAPSAQVAYSFRHAIYDESKEDELFFGIPRHSFIEAISSNNLEWVGDEEFDDSSYVLQFEDENRVRVVAFTGTPDFLYDHASLCEASLLQNEFYWILQVWHDRFKEEWISLPKELGF